MREELQRHALLFAAGASSGFLLNEGDGPIGFGLPSLLIAVLSAAECKQAVDGFVFLFAALFGAGAATVHKAHAMTVQL